jgi:hypothetical protein
MHIPSKCAANIGDVADGAVALATLSLVNDGSIIAVDRLSFTGGTYVGFTFKLYRSSQFNP